jgi:hypothetical protein
VKRLTFCVLCLAFCLAVLATSPPPVAADCQEGCCAQAAQDVEGYCARLGSSVRYFDCVEGWGGSCCAFSWDCYPPAQ